MLAEAELAEKSAEESLPRRSLSRGKPAEEKTEEPAPAEKNGPGRPASDAGAANFYRAAKFMRKGLRQGCPSEDAIAPCLVRLCDTCEHHSAEDKVYVDPSVLFLPDQF